MVKTRSRKRIVRRKSMRGGDDSLEARLAAATAKREKADRELAATKAVAAEKAQSNVDPALTQLRTLRATEAKLAEATAKREKADRELAATKAVAAEKAEEDDDQDAPTPGEPEIGSPAYFAARIRRGGTSRSRRSRRKTRRSTRGRRR
jgi:hypothetical protein